MIPTRITLLNTPIDTLTMQQTLARIDSAIAQRRPLKHVVVNVAKLVYMQKNKELYDSVVASDIINPDGLPVVWAARFLGKKIPERVAGIDLMQNLVERAAQKGHKIFFLGARPQVVEAVVEKYSQQFSPQIIAGYRNGYFSTQEEEQIARQIAQSQADILFVAIPSPRKEIFLQKYKDLIQTPFVMGVGGSFDVVAGKVKRAPLWMQKSGLEWLFRLLQEPRRMWKRYFTTNSLFFYYLLKEKLSLKRKK